jgi:hypothetical protein
MREVHEIELVERPYKSCPAHHAATEAVLKEFGPNLRQLPPGIYEETLNNLVFCRLMSACQEGCTDCVREVLWKNELGLCTDHLESFLVRLSSYPKDMDPGALETFIRDHATEMMLECIECCHATEGAQESWPEEMEASLTEMAETVLGILNGLNPPPLPGLKKVPTDEMN